MKTPAEIPIIQNEYCTALGIVGGGGEQLLLQVYNSLSLSTVLWDFNAHAATTLSPKKMVDYGKLVNSMLVGPSWLVLVGDVVGETTPNCKS